MIRKSIFGNWIVFQYRQRSVRMLLSGQELDFYQEIVEDPFRPKEEEFLFMKAIEPKLFKKIEDEWRTSMKTLDLLKPRG